MTALFYWPAFTSEHFSLNSPLQLVMAFFDRIPS
jgi:hypothetical protein